MQRIKDLDDVAERSAFFVKCIENLERSDRQPGDIYVNDIPEVRPTCIDYFLDLVGFEAARVTRGGGSVIPKHVLRIDRYNGRLGWLRTQISENGPSLVAASDALTWLYFQNPHITRPWATQCVHPATSTAVDCISKAMDFWGEEAGYTYHPDGLAINIHTNLNRIAHHSATCAERGRIVSCLEKLMQCAVGGHPYRWTDPRMTTLLKQNVIASSTINWFLPCANRYPEDLERGQTCFEALLTNSEYTGLLNYLHDSRPAWIADQMQHPRKYAGHDTPVPGYRAFIERVGSGAGFIHALKSMPIGDLVDKTCTNLGGEETSCYDAALDRLVDDNDTTISPYDWSTICHMLIVTNQSMLTSTACIDHGNRVSCLGKVLNHYRQTPRFLSSLTVGTIVQDERFDLVGMACQDDQGRPATCLDRIVDLASPGDVMAIASRYPIVGPAACTDAAGRSVTCLDKIVQMATVKTYARSRAGEIDNELGRLDTRANRATRDATLATIATRIGVLKQDLKQWEKATTVPEGEGIIHELIPTLKADLAMEPCHAPKGRPEFVRAVERHLSRLTGDADDLQAKIRRSRSDAKRAEYGVALNHIETRRATVRRFYDEISGDADETMPCINRIMDLTELGLPLAPMRAPVSVAELFLSKTTTYKEQTCRTGRGERVSCLQRAIDLARYADDLGRDGYCTAHTSFDAEMSVPDIMAPVCRDEEYEPCLVYLLKGRQATGITPELAASLLSRSDFDSLPDEVRTRDGSTFRIKDAVCQRASIPRLVDHLRVRRMAREPPRGRYSYDGEALELFAKCKCSGDITPMQRRNCVDDLCLRGFLNAGARTAGNWANRYIVRPDLGMSPYVMYDGVTSDLYGLNGIYTINYVARNDAGPAVRYVRLVMGNPSADDEVGQRGLWSQIREELHGAWIDMGDAGRAQIRLRLIPPSPDLYLADGTWTTFSDVDTGNGSIPDVYGGDYTVEIQYQDDAGAVLATDTVPIARMRKKRAIKREMKKHLDDNNLWAAFDRIATSRPSIRPKKYLLVISNRPRDLMRASSCQYWRSCYTFGDGFDGFNAIPTFLGGGGYIAYLVDSDEFATTYLARTFLVPMADGREDIKQIKREGGGCIDVQQPYGPAFYGDIVFDAVAYILHAKGINRQGAPNCARCLPQAVPAGNPGGQYLFATTQRAIVEKARAEYVARCVYVNGESERQRCVEESTRTSWSTLLLRGFISPETSLLVREALAWKNYVDNRDQYHMVPPKYRKIMITDQDIEALHERYGPNFVDMAGVRPLTLPRGGD